MATMIQAVDDGVGKIQSTLEELKLTDNTVILFYSDNGGYGPATDMAPLKGYKGTYYEGGIRVPFFAKWPGVIQPGSRSSEPIIGVDLYPTLCDIANTAMPQNQPVDGVSLLPLLKQKVSSFEHRSLFWHFPAYLQSYAVVNEQRDVLFRSRPCSVIRKGSWKLHHYFEDNGLELYNLNDDIGEKMNLVSGYPEKTKQLLDELKTWRKTIHAPVPIKKNPGYDHSAETAAIQKMKNRKLP